MLPLAGLPVGADHALDVVAARAAGLPGVHLDRTGTGPLGDGPRITTLAALPEALDGLAEPLTTRPMSQAPANVAP